MRVRMAVSNDSNNDLAPSRWQAIILTNDGLLHWHIYEFLSLGEASRNNLVYIIFMIDYRYEVRDVV